MAPNPAKEDTMEQPNQPDASQGMATLTAITTRTHAGTCEAIARTWDAAITNASSASVYDLVAMADQLIASGDLDCTCGQPRTITRMTVPCARCGYPIWAGAAGYVHVDPTTGQPLDRGRGCRSASFSRDGMWDDRLGKRWLATPPSAA